ncbi:MAG: hypothetical protein LBP93_02895 [Treponema sp.]|jgi:hypothetical protein|nr:hypothetical protein [Treponema sp.]
MDVIETILPILPIVLILTLRFLFWKRRQAGNQRQEDASPLGDRGETKGSGPALYGKTERPWVHAVYEEEDKDSGAEFSAWDLPVNAGPPPPKLEKAPPPVFKAPAIPRMEKEAEAPPPAPGKRVPAAEFPENLAALSPLRRAVVLAEILGPPKGV